MRLNRLAILITCVLTLVWIPSCRHQSRQTYVLGVIGNLEGKNANTDGLRSIQMAVEDYHRDHPRSPRIDILPMDDSWTADKCREAYRQLQPRCNFMFLQTTSTAFLGVYPDILQNPGILHMTVGPATTEISDKNDNVIRNNPDTRLEQTSISNYMTGQKVNRVLIARETERNKSYTDSAILQFRNTFKGQVVETTFSADQFDLTAVMKAFNANDYDMVYILSGGTPAEAAVIVQSIHRLKPAMPIMTTPWIRGRFFSEAVGAFSTNVIVPEYTFMTPKNKDYVEFSEAFRKRFDSEPGYTAYYCHDLAIAFLQALDRTGKTDARTLLDEMTRRSYQGVNGEFRFTKSGDVDSPLHFYKLNGPGYELIQ